MEAHVLSILLLGLSSFIVGTIPLKLARRDQQPFAISLLLCLGGGVILSTSVVHMLSETRETLPKYGEIIYCSGFLLLYAIDEIIHSFIGNSHSIRASFSHSRSRTNSQGSTSDSDNSRVYQKAQTSYGTIESIPNKREDSQLAQLNFPTYDHHHKSFNHQSTRCCKKHEKEKRGGWINSQFLPPDRKPSLERDSESTTSFYSRYASQELCHVEVKQQPCPSSSMSLPGLLTALLLHAILEGCSIGVQTKSNEILLVVAAVACHKLVLAFCLGLELANAGYTGFKFILTIAIFSLGCPVGIGIGITLTQASETLFFLEAPLQAVAGGSLLYVAVFEVLPRERFKWQHKTELRFAGVYQYFFVLLGFSSLTVVDQFTDFHGH